MTLQFGPAVLALCLVLPWPVTADAQDRPVLNLVDRAERPTHLTNLSLLATSCNLGIFAGSDKDIGFDRIAALKDDLNAGPPLPDKPIVVTQYGFYINKHAWYVNSNPAGHGFLGAMLNPVGCPKEKVKAGWYDPKEAAAGASPVVIELTAEVDGRAYAVRLVRSPPVAQVGNPFVALRPDLRTMAGEADAALAEQIRGGPASAP